MPRTLVKTIKEVPDSSVKLTTATGDAPSYSARAWVNFNGTGTPAIRGSGNVTSITKAGTGEYIVNFTTSMPDANSSVSLMGSDTLTPNSANFEQNRMSYLPTASGVRVITGYRNGGAFSLLDNVIVFVSVFR